ncbi:MAG: DegV family protein, partial [Eggerthellaceae bacterium]|nr:DegV family protein [Eggerthellaceae bacterium]
ESQYETSRMLSDIVNLLWSRAREKGLHFEVNVGESVPSMLYGDEMRLKQVVINVLTNAIKYTEEGTVTLTVDGEQRSGNEFLLRVDVDDTGIGIRKEAIPYLFDSFKRVDTERNKNVEGTGLGLAISKQLVDLMGGTITVDSIFTKGSHFQIEVPQRIVSAEPMHYTSVTARSDSASYENVFEAPEAHVLIVDDNDMNRMVARKLLRATRVQTDVAASGREALDKTADVRYDVIFMDHEMPDMDGIQALQALRDQPGGLNKGTPVVALTANAGSDMNAFYLNQGFQAYLAKPIHGSLLEATLLQFLPSELIERTGEVDEGESIQIAASRYKRAIAVTVDCPCDLPEETLAAAGIRRMPFYIVTDEGRFRDVEEIDSDNLFSYFDGGGTATTSPGTVEEYEQFFGEVLTGAETIVHVSVESSVSKAYETACRASESFGNVYVVDSHQFSSGLGLVALEAARLADAGMDVAEVVQATDKFSDQVQTTVLVTSLESPTIQKGMPAPLRAIIKALSLEPVLTLKRGGLRFHGFHGGYVTGAAEKYIRSAMRRARHSSRKDFLYVTFAGCSLKEQEAILALVEKETKDFKGVVMQKASATVAANTWMHSFGIMYVK